MTILEFPPMQSFKIWVNFEFLHGINLLLEAKAFIHIPKFNKLLLIFAPSCCLTLFLFTLFLLLLLLLLFITELVFSLPAKSTKINLPLMTLVEFGPSLSLFSILIFNNA